MTNYVGPQPLSLKVKKPTIVRKTVDLSMDSMPILGIDPGGTTGWSLLVVRPKLFQTPKLATQDRLLATKLNWWHGQINCLGTNQQLGVHQLKRIIDDWPTAAIVMESFFLRKTARGIDLSPVEIIAQIRNHLYYQGREMHMQQPSQAKTTATDARLKLWGTYTSDGGMGHARDADRHVMLFLRRCIGAQGNSLRTLAWPHIFR